MSPLFEESENDLPLPRRGPAGEGDTRHAREIEDAREPGREVTLNTGVVLALFFALALLCAVFFGFGYSMGRKSIPPPAIAEGDTSSIPGSDGKADAPKPSPGSPAIAAPVPGYAGTAAATPEAKAAPAKTVPAAASTTVTVQPPARSQTTADPTSGTQSGAPIVRVAPTPSASTSASPATGTGTIYVQVSAVSHQEDANVLLSALRRRGYTVFTRSDANDSLIHVQLGPFPTKKDADAMRQRLSGDGYNAILK